jgi:hypothetical protein
MTTVRIPVVLTDVPIRGLAGSLPVVLIPTALFVTTNPSNPPDDDNDDNHNDDDSHNSAGSGRMHVSHCVFLTSSKLFTEIHYVILMGFIQVAQ